MIHHIAAHVAEHHDFYRREVEEVLRGLRVFVTGHRVDGRAEMEQAAGYAEAAGAASVTTALEQPDIDAVIESEAVLAVRCASYCPHALADIAVAEAMEIPVYHYAA